MIMRKKLYITVLVSIISALGIWFIILDFSRFISLDFSYDIYPSALLKRIDIILASIIAWTVGQDGLGKEDSRLIKWAFVFVCLGETAFIMGGRFVGIYLFAVCQILLIMRNSTGLFYKLSHGSYKQKKRLILSVAFVYLVFLVFLFLSGSFVGLNSTSLTAYLYGVVLSTSLLAGLACNILGLLPRRNAEMAAAGIVCFFCCDILVGLDAVLWKGLPWLLSNSFIWIFYIPALVLLALSCYRYS